MPAYPLYSDDEAMICGLLKDEWSLEFDKPKFYYLPNALARDNNPGSIYIYDLSRSYPAPRGTNYEFTKMVRRMGIDIQVPENRERKYRYVNEVLRILMKYRRAGPDRLGGWEYLEIGTITDRQGYVNFYHTVIEISLTRECNPLIQAGFGNDCRRPECPCDPCVPNPNDNPPAWDPF